MKYLYAIRDLLAGEVVGQIQMFPADTVAIRMFSDVVADEQTIVRRHPKDFDLVRLASISGFEIVVSDVPEVLLTAEQVVAAMAARDDAIAASRDPRQLDLLQRQGVTRA